MAVPKEPTEGHSAHRTYIYVVLGVIIVVIVGYWYYGFTQPNVKYRAILDDSYVVPNPTNSTASGETDFTMSSGGSTMHFSLYVKNIVNVTAAHIHLGNASQNGPVIVPLFLGPEKVGSFTGTLAEGDITAATLTGQLAGKSISDLISNINSKKCYVNVHTTAFPGGEIRGQITPYS